MEKTVIDKKLIRKLVKGDESRKGISSTEAGSCCAVFLFLLVL